MGSLSYNDRLRLIADFYDEVKVPVTPDWMERYRRLRGRIAELPGTAVGHISWDRSLGRPTAPTMTELGPMAVGFDVVEESHEFLSVGHLGGAETFEESTLSNPVTFKWDGPHDEERYRITYVCLHSIVAGAGAGEHTPYNLVRAALTGAHWEGVTRAGFRYLTPNPIRYAHAEGDCTPLPEMEVRIATITEIAASESVFANP